MMMPQGQQRHVTGQAIALLGLLIHQFCVIPRVNKRRASRFRELGLFTFRRVTLAELPSYRWKLVVRSRMPLAGKTITYDMAIWTKPLARRTLARAQATSENPITGVE